MMVPVTASRFDIEESNSGAKRAFIEAFHASKPPALDRLTTEAALAPGRLLLTRSRRHAMYGIYPDTDFSFLIGRRLDEVSIGAYQFGLSLDGDVYIAMGENEFAVSADPAHVSERHEATAACVSGIAPLVKLIGQSITAVSVDRSNEVHSLVLRFGESFLTLYDSGSDKGFESFHINTPDQTIVV